MRLVGDGDAFDTVKSGPLEHDRQTLRNHGRVDVVLISFWLLSYCIPFEHNMYYFCCYM